MIPKSYVESLAVSPEIVEEDLAVIDVGDLVFPGLYLMSKLKVDKAANHL
jgi:hypothetical protein